MVCGVDLEDVGAGTRAGGEVEVEAADIFRDKIDITFWSLSFFGLSRSHLWKSSISRTIYVLCTS